MELVLHCSRKNCTHTRGYQQPSYVPVVGRFGRNNVTVLVTRRKLFGLFLI